MKILKIILISHQTLLKELKIKYFLLLILNFLISITQTLGVVSIYPLIALLTASTSFKNNLYYKKFIYTIYINLIKKKNYH